MPFKIYANSMVFIIIFLCKNKSQVCYHVCTVYEMQKPDLSIRCVRRGCMLGVHVISSVPEAADMAMLGLSQNNLSGYKPDFSVVSMGCSYQVKNQRLVMAGCS